MAGAALEQTCPQAFSSLATALRTAERDMPRRGAASDRLPALATWTNRAINFKSCMGTCRLYGNSIVYILGLLSPQQAPYDQ